MVYIPQIKDHSNQALVASEYSEVSNPKEPETVIVVNNNFQSSEDSIS